MYKATDAGLTKQEREIKGHALKYLESPEFDAVHRKLDRYWRPPVVWRYVAAFLAFLTTVGIPFALYQIFRILQHKWGRQARKAELIERARRSIPVLLYPIMVNTSLTKVPGATAPALFAGTLDPECRNDARFMLDVMGKVADVELNVPEDVTNVEQGAFEDEDQRAIAALYSDLAYQPHRRRLDARLDGGEGRLRLRRPGRRRLPADRNV